MKNKIYKNTLMNTFFATLLLLISVQLSAQTSQAKTILDKVSEQTKSYKSITADFDFNMINREVDINESNQGNIIVQNNQYQLTLSGIKIFNNGESQWTYMEDAGEVNISDAGNQDEGAINPANIFTIYEKGYNYQYLGDASFNKRKVYQIALIPIDEQEFSKVILDIYRDDYQIAKATMMANDGNEYEIVIRKMTTDKVYPASTFVFNASEYSEVDVIDMR